MGGAADEKLDQIPAKFGFDMEEWPGDEPGPNQVFTVMAQAFHWDTTQLEWFLKRKGTWCWKILSRAHHQKDESHRHAAFNTYS